VNTFGPTDFFGELALLDDGLRTATVTATWYGFPFMMLAATAGLKMIPLEVYDAASIDGANAWGKFWHINLAYAATAAKSPRQPGRDPVLLDKTSQGFRAVLDQPITEGEIPTVTSPSQPILVKYPHRIMVLWGLA